MGVNKMSSNKLIQKDAIHVVIDIETLARSQDILEGRSCPVLEAAFVTVKQKNGRFEIDRCLARSFNITYQKYWGIDYTCPDTLKRHLEKNNDNYQAMIKSCEKAPHDAFFHFLSDLHYYLSLSIHNQKNIHYWSMGKDFDYPILDALAHAQNITTPWQLDYGFTRIHCLRDIIAWEGFDRSSAVNSNPHRALEDALYEANVLCQLLDQKMRR